MRLLRTVLTAFVPPLTVALLIAQSPPPPEASTPTLHVTTSETIVDVLVSDQQGHPVHGLTQGDFTISEDGKPQAIRSFSETRRDSPARAATAVAKLPPNTYTNRQPAPAAGASNIILIDAMNVDTMGLMLSRQQAAKYFNAMAPGTQLALFELRDKLRILEGFTADPAALIAAMDDNKNSLLPPPNAIVPCIPAELTLNALRQIAAFVSGIKGRKNLLWFVAQPPPLYDPCDPNLERETFATLAAAQVAIYPIDVRGVFNPTTADASQPLTNITVHTGKYDAAGAAMAYTVLGAQHIALDGLAERTGGVAFYNTNNLPSAIGSAIESGANYYTLSYVPPGRGYDARHHSIHVTVNRPHVTLVYRPGYGEDEPKLSDGKPIVPTKLASTTPDAAANTMNASMARFAPSASQLLFDVKLTPATNPPLPTDPPLMGFPVADIKSKPLTRYDILYSIPPDQLTFATPPDGTHDSSVQFVVVASDVFGKLVTSASQTMQLPLSPSEYAEFLRSPFQFLQQIDLPAGQIFLRIGILEPASNRIGTIEIPLTVAKTTTASLSPEKP